MHRWYFLSVTAAGEGATGLALLAAPALPLRLLLGVTEVAPEATLLARVAGAALLALGVASGLGRAVGSGSAQTGLLVGLLIYDVAAAVLLGHAGLVSGTVGPALWPAVGVHTVMSVWCVYCLREKS
jgi:hypothetical protein